MMATFFLAIWPVVMEMARFVYGIGRRREWWPNGRLMIVPVFLFSGIRMKRVNWPQQVGTEASSIGIKMMYETMNHKNKQS